MKDKIFLGLIIASFFFGLKVNSWYYASQRLIIEETQREEREAFVKRESKISALVEQKIQRLKANERVIERFRKEVVEHPVYRNDCIDADGLRIINGEVDTESTEPSNQVPP